MREKGEQVHRHRGRAQLVSLATAAFCLLWGASLLTGPRQLPVPAPSPHHVALPAAPRHAVGGATAVTPIDCGRTSCLALTFDDGPNPTVTPQVLDILDRHHVQATFFLIGSRVAGNEALLRRMHQAGHEIGNHSWSHVDFTTLSP